MRKANQAVVWSVLLGVWQLFAGAISFYLLARFLSDTERGYYTTFWSFIAGQALIDSGLTIVVTNFCSHEWGRLSLADDGSIQGDSDSLSRLVSLGRFSAAWFCIGAILFVFIAGLAGAYVFAAVGDDNIHWQWPWVATVLLGAGSVVLSPWPCILQGCSQVEPVYRFRLFQAVLTNFGIWITLLAGGGLWAAVTSVGVRFGAEVVFLVLGYGPFLRPFLSRPTGQTISFWKDIWPVQWRVSLGGIFSYFAYFLFNPVIMYYHSAELAGRMGMTRQLLQTAQTATQSVIQTRVPEFGQLVALGDNKTLDKSFFKLMTVSVISFAIAGIGYLFGLSVLEMFLPNIRSALLDFWPSLLLVVGMAFFQISFAEVQYVRAHKQEPIFVAALVSNAVVALAVYILGKEYGVLGASGGYALATLLVTVPGFHYSFAAFRKRYWAERLPRENAPHDNAS